MPLEVRVLPSVGAVDPTAWDALVGEGSPFLEHTFLDVLERSKSVGRDTGWDPCPVTVWDGDRLVGAAPAWLKSHSYGEFVYDWQWASAAKRSGRRYYPKLVVAVPFSPVAGRRLLVEEGPGADGVRAALIAGLQALGRRVAGLHVLFPDDEDAVRLVAAGGMERLQWQYHWENRDYTCFEDFLRGMPSKRRTEIRRERRSDFGLRFTAGLGPDPALAAFFYRLYQDTYERHTGGEGYLTEAFFPMLFQRWGHRVHTVMAWEGDTPVAGTFNVFKGDRLYGRYWGTTRDVPFLHFEVAIYRAVDWCIANGVRVFEPGHGGEHKRARGFEPRLTRSAHWLTDPDLDAALRKFCAEEAAFVREHVEG